MADSLRSENNSLSVLHRHDQIASSNPLMLSNEFRQKMTFINFAIICTSIALFGIMANVINITVFVKQGFNDTVNISLFTLALADMASLCFLVWVGICFNKNIGPHLQPLESTQVVYMTGGQPRLYFTRVAGWITSLVSIERCVCVLKPLQVKLIFTKRLLVTINVLILITTFSTMIPVLYTTYLTWKVDRLTNRSYVGLAFRENRHSIDKISFILGACVSLSAFIMVTLCTFILSWSLIKQSRWRAKSMSEGANSSKEEDGGQKNAPKISNRDRQIVKTITFIAAIFVVCFFPNALSLTIMSIVPEYNKEAKYNNIFLVVWSFAQMSEAISSSVNIFVYYKTSTRFKETMVSIIVGITGKNGTKS